MSEPEACGCAGLGAHVRWCRAVVGTPASVYGPFVEDLEAMGDAVGANNPGLANRLYALSGDVRAWVSERYGV